MTNDQRARIIWTVMIALGAMGFVGLTSLCLTLFYKNYADPAVLTAIIAITSGVIGSLSSLAIPKPQGPPGLADSVTIDNPPDKPVPTQEQPKP